MELLSAAVLAIVHLVLTKRTVLVIYYIISNSVLDNTYITLM